MLHVLSGPGVEARKKERLVRLPRPATSLLKQSPNHGSGVDRADPKGLSRHRITAVACDLVRISRQSLSIPHVGRPARARSGTGKLTYLLSERLVRSHDDPLGGKSAKR